MHILLADDSVPAQNMGKKILSDAGHEVVTASNGRDAFRKIEEKKPDLAILDIFMPGYSGLELCERLRADSQTASLPIVLTVGKLEPYRAEDADRVHSNAVIIKPFAAAELLGIIQQLLGSATPAAPAPASEPAPAPTAAKPPEPKPAAAESDEFPDEMLFGKGISELELPAQGVRSPKGFGFDPDAGHTPFSASAVDLDEAKPATTEKESQPAAAEPEPPPILKPEPEPQPTPAAEAQPAPAAEFAPGDQGPHYSGELDGALTGVEAPKEELSAESSAEANYSGDVLELASLTAPSAAESSAEHGEETERSPLDIPEHDPLMRFSGQPATDGSAIASVEVVPVAAAPASEAATPEMDAERRAAFDALFASAETLMEEPAEMAQHAPAELSEGLLPGFASLSDDHEVEIVQDEEIEFAGEPAHPLQLEPVVSEADPYLLEEVELDRPEKIDTEPVVQAEAQDPLLVCDDGTFASDVLAAGPLDAPASPVTATPVELNQPDTAVLELSPEADAEEVAAAEIAPVEAVPEQVLHAAPAAEILDLAEPVVESEPLVEPEPEPLDAGAAETVVPQPLEATAPAPVATEAESAAAAEPLAEVEPPGAQKIAVAPEAAAAIETPAPKPAEEPLAAVLRHAESTAAPSAPAIAEQIAAARSSVASIEAERIHQAVEKVFARYKPLLVAAIVREIARSSE